MTGSPRNRTPKRLNRNFSKEEKRKESTRAFVGIGESHHFRVYPQQEQFHGREKEREIYPTFAKSIWVAGSKKDSALTVVDSDNAAPEHLK